MKIEPPADDIGLQNLKHADRPAATVPQVDHIEPRARIAPSGERHEPLPVMQERRGGERRSGRDRRRNQEPHLLDTREPHERRTGVRRTTDQTEEEPGQTPEVKPGGIDVLA